jgi:hypothetical protein
LRLRDDADRHVGDRGVEQADAGAGDEEPGEQRRPLGSRFDAGHEEQASPAAANPALIITRAGSRERSAPAIGATTKLAKVIGR